MTPRQFNLILFTIFTALLVQFIIRQPLRKQRARVTEIEERVTNLEEVVTVITLTAVRHRPAPAPTVQPAPTSAVDSARAVHALLLASIQIQETGGEADPAQAVTNNGRDCGWYQICPAYYADAVDSSLGRTVDWPTYEQAVTSRVWSERLVVCYWSRYAVPARQGDSDQARARINNGGPQGHKHNATLKYWAEVQSRL